MFFQTAEYACQYINSHAALHQNTTQTLFKKFKKKQDPAIQYTKEYENENKSLNFLDINIPNNINNKYEFKVHHKKAITNIVHRP